MYDKQELAKPAVGSPRPPSSSDRSALQKKKSDGLRGSKAEVKARSMIDLFFYLIEFEIIKD